MTRTPHVGRRAQQAYRDCSDSLLQTLGAPAEIAQDWPEGPSGRQGAHRVVGATSKVPARRAPPGGVSSGRWCFAGGVRGGPDVCAGGVADRTVRTHVKGRREPSGAVLEACGASLRSRAEQVGVLAVQRGSAPGVRTALRAGDVLSSKTAAS